VTARAGAPRPPAGDVSERAFVARISRALKHKEQKLCTTGRYNANVGRYYRIDTYSNLLLYTHVNLESLGRELNVLARWEELIKIS
jgi:hypothetical protein